MRRLAALLVGAALLLPPGTVHAATTPPPHKLRVYDVLLEPTRNEDGSCTLRGAGSVRWRKAPRRTANTVGHYLRLRTQIQTLVGQTVKKRTYRSRTFGKGLPMSRTLATSTTLTPGLGSFRTKVTALVVRDVRTGTDKTVWKVVRTSEYGQCWGGGGGT